MPKGSNQKFKLYRLAQIMQEKTDDEHYITMPEIMKELAKYDITADRKSIYNDLRDLSVLGIDVEGEPDGNRYHYHVVDRAFELPELKLLVDAIQSSKFITEKKSNALIKKLETLVSKYDAQKLQRQVFVSGRIKTMNESIYYTVDAIHNAIISGMRKKTWNFATVVPGITLVPGAYPGIMKIIIWSDMTQKKKRLSISAWTRCCISNYQKKAEKEMNILKSWIWQIMRRKVLECLVEKNGQ